MRKLMTLFNVKRLGLLLLLFLFTGACLQAQDDAGILSTRITYETTRAPLSRVLKEIREKAKVRFTYNNGIIDKQPPVTVKVVNVALETLLTEVLANTDLKFTVAMGGVVIYGGEKKKAQNGVFVVLRGRVVNQGNEPLGGVTIHAVNSNTATVTAPDGLFMMTAKPGEQVSFTMVGMKTLTHKASMADNNDVQVFKMDSLVKEMQEIVVTGYQKIDARMYTGSVSKLSAEQMMEAGVPTIDKMLQGKVPGLMVVNNSGGVNAKPTLRIRGTSTLLGNASPLWVIDGMIRPDPVNISNAQLKNLVDAASQSNFELMGNAVSGVNPYDVENLTFLKDAAATSIYGTRAANGVIVITTKRGKAGPMQVSYNTDISMQGRPSYHKTDLMNSKERVEFSRQLQEDGVVYNGNVSGMRETNSYEGLLRALYAREITEDEFRTKVATLETRNTDWFKELFRNQVSQNHSISMSGGVGKTTYYSSLRYSDAKGSAKMDANRSYGALATINSEIGKKLTTSLSIEGSYRKATGYYNTISPLAYALQTNRSYGTDDVYPIQPSQPFTINSSDLQQLPGSLVNPPYTYNILNEIAHTSNSSVSHSSSVNFLATYSISKKLKLNSQSNAIIDQSDGITAYDQESYAAAVKRSWNWDATPPPSTIAVSPLPSGGVANINSQKSVTIGTRNSIDFNTAVAHNRDQFNLTIGNEISSQTIQGFSSTNAGYFPDRGKTFYASPIGRREINTIALTDNRINRVGWYSTASYYLKSRYTLNGSIRTDGSNRFGQYSNSKFLPNWSVSGRWDLSSEKWFRIGFIDYWNFRASYGTQGNAVDAVGPNLVAGYRAITIDDERTQLPYLHIKTMPYPDLRWEKTYQSNFGTSLSMLKNRVELDFQYFFKKTVDALDQIEIPYEYGMETMFRNGSKLFNSGWDASLNVTIIRKKDMGLSMSFITSRIKNSLPEDVNQGNFSALFDGSGHLPGKPISGFYSYKFAGLNHNTGLPEFANLDRATKTSNPDELFVYSGQLNPTITFSTSPVFHYKAFAVSAQFFLSLGSSKRLNSPFALSGPVSGLPLPYENISRLYMNRWRKPGDELTTNIPGLTRDLGGVYVYVPYVNRNIYNVSTDIQVNPLEAYNLSDLRTVKNNWMRCNNLNMSYTIPRALLRNTWVKNLNVGATVRNLFTIANKALNGQDPEIQDLHGSYTTLPITRSYALSLNLSL